MEKRVETLAVIGQGVIQAWATKSDTEYTREDHNTLNLNVCVHLFVVCGVFMFCVYHNAVSVYVWVRWRERVYRRGEITVWVRWLERVYRRGEITVSSSNHTHLIYCCMCLVVLFPTITSYEACPGVTTQLASVYTVPSARANNITGQDALRKPFHTVTGLDCSAETLHTLLHLFSHKYNLDTEGVSLESCK